MAINFGNSEIDKIFFGSSQIDKVYKGSQLIYELSNPVATGSNLYGWGKNNFRQTGISITGNILEPTLVSEYNNISEIATGVDCSAFIKDGILYIWGNGANNNLGFGNTTSKYTPTQLGTDSDWNKITFGYTHTLGIKNNGELWGWGNSDNYAQGVGAAIELRKIATPTRAGTDTDWTNIYAGWNYTIGEKNGVLYGWGRNYNYQTGTNKDSNSSQPIITPVLNQELILGYSKISVGYQHTLLINNGELFGWGNGAGYAFGNGSLLDLKEPTKIGTYNDWTDVAAGYLFSFGIRNGELYYWGSSARFPFGEVTTPMRIGTYADWTKINATTRTIIAFRGNDMYTLGDNTYGQIGNGTTTAVTDLTYIGSNFSIVATNSHHILALKGTINEPTPE